MTPDEARERDRADLARLYDHAPPGADELLEAIWAWHLRVFLRTVTVDRVTWSPGKHTDLQPLPGDDVNHWVSVSFHYPSPDPDQPTEKELARAAWNAATSNEGINHTFDTWWADTRTVAGSSFT